MLFTRRRLTLAFAAVCTLVAVGCAETTRTGATSSVEAGTFAWFDLATDNPSAAKDFYGDLFGWRFSQRRGGDYWTIRSGDIVLGGLFPTEQSAGNTEIRSQWVPVFGVSDAIASSQKAFALGARQVAPPAQASNEIYSSIYDPTGAALDLYQGPSGILISESGLVGTWIWTDHFSSNPAKAARFYSSLFGYESGRGDTGERVLRLNGNELGGLVFVPASEADPNWLPYVAVSDIEATLGKARSLGAGLIARDETAAILLDPTGAAIGVIAEGE